VQLPRDWFGPRDELVPLRTGRARSDAPSSEATPTDEAPSNGARAPMAVDFWGGVTAPEELVPFPGRSSEQAEGRDGTTATSDRAATTRARFRTAGRGRRAAVGLAIVFLGLIAVRIVGAQSTPARTGPRPDRIAQVSQPGRSIDFRDEPRTRGRRRLASAPHHAAAQRRPAIRHVHISQPHAQSPPASAGQPVAYSPPTTSQSSGSSSDAAVSSSGSGSEAAAAASASSGSGSGGTGSQSGAGSSRPGPTGPGATFGPGQIGK
jgi:hypothetical protein